MPYGKALHHDVFENGTRYARALPSEAEFVRSPTVVVQFAPDASMSTSAPSSANSVPDSIVVQASTMMVFGISWYHI